MATPQLNILIVDDDQNLGSTLQDILQTEGYSTVFAEDGLIALTLCRNGGFDLALIDIRLPDISGAELVEKLVKISPRMECIIITGYASLDDAIKAVRHKNIIAYETKPLEIDNLLLLITQVAERKRTEAALKKSETRFRNLVEDTSAGIAIMDPSGRFVYFNNALGQLMGYSEEEILGKSLADFLHPDDKGLVIPQLQQVLAQPEVKFDLEFRVIHKSGNIVHLHSRPNALIYDDETAGLSAIITNVTERRQAEDLLKTISEQSPIGVYIVQDGEFQYINPQLQQSLGYSKEELLNTDSLSYVFPGDRDVVRANAILMLQGKLPYPYEYRIISKIKESRWVIETVSSIQYQGRRATLGNCMDITERKQIEKKVIEYEELNKLKSDLLSTVSHELRTPLTTIKGYSTMIIDYESRLSGQEKRECLQSIDRATDRLSELVDHLLDMSRLEAGLLRLDLEMASISRLVKLATTEAHLRTPQNGIVVDIGKRLPRIMIDTKRIQGVLDNLLDNACKYSYEGTEVVMSARRVNGEVLISVTNQGIGIPAGELRRVFDRMYRIEQRLNAGTSGLGLGLALCKGLVEAHGGRIWMESKEGEWAKCSFTLPI
ncbi:PAS domain S-box protein [Chloroflexota bacterium]